MKFDPEYFEQSKILFITQVKTSINWQMVAGIVKHCEKIRKCK